MSSSSNGHHLDLKGRLDVIERVPMTSGDRRRLAALRRAVSTVRESYTELGPVPRTLVAIPLVNRGCFPGGKV